jgi:hypothetical protein
MVSHRVQLDQKAKANDARKPKAPGVEPKFYADRCGLAHLKDCLGDSLGNRTGEWTVSPFVRRRHLHRV